MDQIIFNIGKIFLSTYSYSHGVHCRMADDWCFNPSAEDRWVNPVLQNWGIHFFLFFLLFVPRHIFSSQKEANPPGEIQKLNYFCYCLSKRRKWKSRGQKWPIFKKSIWISSPRYLRFSQIWCNKAFVLPTMTTPITLNLGAAVWPYLNGPPPATSPSSSSC